MKNVFNLRIVLALVLSLAMFSCSKSSSKNSSRGTGWNINAKEGGFQYNTDFVEQETAPGLVFIEGGTFTMGKVQDDVMHDWNNTPNQQHIQSWNILIGLKEYTHQKIQILKPFTMVHFQIH